MPLANLSGQTALVTGGAKRIGRAIALALAGEGADVVVHYRSSREEAEALRGKLASLGVRAWTVGADFADEAETASLIARAAELAGPLSLLVNSASDFPPSTLENVTWSDVQRQIEVTAWAPFVLCREFVGQAQGGSIVNLLDSRVTGWDENHVAYLWAKQLFAAMTSPLALAYAPAFTVNGVAPGLILPPPGGDESYLEALTHTVPLRRHGDPEDIAAAVVFLLKSPFITGEVIFVDGGRHLRETLDFRPKTLDSEGSEETGGAGSAPGLRSNPYDTGGEGCMAL
jgi:NAD(P)-dependent dehydrogenase (short-subunit alcohol dehydrogenase family)